MGLLFFLVFLSACGYFIMPVCKICKRSGLECTFQPIVLPFVLGGLPDDHFRHSRGVFVCLSKDCFQSFSTRDEFQEHRKEQCSPPKEGDRVQSWGLDGKDVLAHICVGPTGKRVSWASTLKSLENNNLLNESSNSTTIIPSTPSSPAIRCRG